MRDDLNSGNRRMNKNQTGNKPMPYFSLCGAIGFAASIIALIVREIVHTPESTMAAQRPRILNVMLCLLLASWSSIVSLVTAWCPVILAGDRRPLFWVVPLLFGWIVFVELFDWTSLAPQRP